MSNDYSNFNSGDFDSEIDSEAARVDMENRYYNPRNIRPKKHTGQGQGNLTKRQGMKKDGRTVRHAYVNQPSADDQINDQLQ